QGTDQRRLPQVEQERCCPTDLVAIWPPACHRNGVADNRGTFEGRQYYEGRKCPDGDAGFLQPWVRSVTRRVLRGRRKNTNTLVELSLVLDINYSDMVEGLLHYIKQAVADEGQLPADSTELALLALEHFTQLEIPVPDFQETDIFQIHRAR